MQLKVNDTVTLHFRDIGNEWNAPVRADNAEFEITLKQNIFQADKNLTPETVRRFIDQILKDLAQLTSKSQNVFIALHTEIFGNEYDEKHGYFDLYNINIKSVAREIGSTDLYKCHFDLIFTLESKTNEILDPYFDYVARFKIEYNALSMVGVERVIP